jgi:hypothetical protein
MEHALCSYPAKDKDAFDVMSSRIYLSRFKIQDPPTSSHLSYDGLFNFLLGCNDLLF